MKIVHQLLCFPRFLFELNSLPLFTKNVQIISDKTKNQKVICPWFFFEQQFPVNIFVIQGVDSLVIGDDDDVTSISNLGGFDNSSRENEDQNDRDDQEIEGKY